MPLNPTRQRSERTVQRSDAGMAGKGRINLWSGLVDRYDAVVVSLERPGQKNPGEDKGILS